MQTEVGGMTNEQVPDSRAALRWTVYWLLIAVAAGGMLARIGTVKSSLGQTPLLSANDRSRWCTIRALGDNGTYAIDHILFKPNGKRDREWYTIDMVRHKGRDGQEHFYSSKPPLLATLLAGEYWLIKTVTGATLAEHPFFVVRVMLFTTNVLPLILYLVLLAKLVERLGATDFGRLYVMAAATCGTFLTTFAVTLNNHVPAAVSALLTVYVVWPREQQRTASLRNAALAGGLAAFTFANELPALSFFALLAGLLFWWQPKATLVGFAPAAAVVLAAMLLTNYLAHESWRPPYAHRRDGRVLATSAADWRPELESGRLPEELRGRLASQKIELSEQTTVSKSSESRWVVWDADGHDRFAVVWRDGQFAVREWDNWYEYENSYWSSGKKQGVDLGEPSRVRYAFHTLIGHHGIFSLTPVWLLSLGGMGMLARRRDPLQRGLGLSASAITVVCLAFYLARPLADRNYGGVACGFRWVFWLAPFWLLCLTPAADLLSRRPVWRAVALVLLAASVASACYASQNPWTHPWLYEILPLHESR